MVMDKKSNPRFVGLVLVFFLPGSAHLLSGHWKAAIAWYFGLFGLLALCSFILSVTARISFITIITVQLLFLLYLVSLFVSSYRPTRRLGCHGWIVFLFFIVICNASVSYWLTSLIKTHIAMISFSVGTSMYPTLKSMPTHCVDITVTNMVAYRSSNPQRGDIVCLVTKNNSRFISKRVVGLPGETLEIRSPYALINGRELLAPSIFKKISSSEEGYVGYDWEIMFPITLGPGEYFLLGDNSPQSTDSRHFGPVSREAIVGQVTRIIFPPWRIRDLTTFDSSNKSDAPETLDKSAQKD